MSRIALSFLAASMVAVSPVHAEPGDISVADYLAAWDAMDGEAIQKEIEATGKIDFEKHPEAKIVTEEIGETAKAYRTSVEADRASGKTPHSCLPTDQVDLSTDILIPHLRQIDASERAQVSLAQAFASLMAKTYPCE